MEKKKTSHPTFLMYLESRATSLYEMKHYSSAKNLRCAANRFRAYLTTIGKRDISFKRLQPSIITNFEEWLKLQGVQRNASSSYMRSLHAAFNQGVKEITAANDSSPKSFIAYENPFAQAYCGVDKTDKRAIDKSYIRIIRQLDLRKNLTELYRYLGKRTRGKYFDWTLRQLELTRDLFIFSFCTRGMAFVDLAFLRKTDIRDGHIHYARHKTRQRIAVKIEPMMKAIIKRWQGEGAYLFPLLTEEKDPDTAYLQYQNKLNIYNRNLKTISQMIGDITLTSYVSRHSWASTAHAEKVPLSIICQSMGHTSERTTRIYLQELDGTELDRSNRKLLLAVFKNRRKY